MINKDELDRLADDIARAARRPSDTRQQAAKVAAESIFQTAPANRATGQNTVTVVRRKSRTIHTPQGAIPLHKVEEMGTTKVHGVSIADRDPDNQAPPPKRRPSFLRGEMNEPTPSALLSADEVSSWKVASIDGEVVPYSKLVAIAWQIDAVEFLDFVRDVHRSETATEQVRSRLRDIWDHGEHWEPRPEEKRPEDDDILLYDEWRW